MTPERLNNILWWIANAASQTGSDITDLEVHELRDLALRGLEAQRGLTNAELIAAIEAAFLLTQRTASVTATYTPAVEHYEALLKEQQRRALPPAPEEKP